VSTDGPHLFLYAATEDAARAAERAVRKVLAQHQLMTAGLRLDRWHPDEQDWEDAAVRMPGNDEERAAERRRLMDDQAQQSAEAGQPRWLVRGTLPCMPRAGPPVCGRWSFSRWQPHGLRPASSPKRTAANRRFHWAAVAGS
jgi:hypothetical protein